MPFAEVQLKIDYQVRNLCCHSYPNHPNGCPNYGKRKTCPPHMGYVDKTLDLSKPVYIIWSIFDFKAHVAKMMLTHPDWTERQVKCCLYWQPRARKVLEQEIDAFHAQYPETTVFRCPEAMGVNVTETMWSIGQMLQWPPSTKTYQVAIAGAQFQSFPKC